MLKEIYIQKIEDEACLFQNRSEKSDESALELAKKACNKRNTILTIISILGPVILSCIYLFFPIDVSKLNAPNTYIDSVSTVVLIVALVYMVVKLNIGQGAVNKLETAKSVQMKQIGSLKERIHTLESDQSFYISATELLGKAMKRGHTSLEELAKVLIAAIYHNLSRVTSDDDITINLYELRSGRVKMVISTTRLQYCDRDSIDIPILYRNPNGVNINDEEIQSYYCIQCMRGRVRSRGKKFILADWKEIVKKFKWNDWDLSEKEEILRNNDHSKCIELGFKYNQYVAFLINRDDGVVIYFEIIANRDTSFAAARELPKVAQKLMETYSPLISILWDISDSPNDQNSN